LNQNLWSEKGQRLFQNERFPENTTAFVQRVKVAPEPNLLIGCVESKVKVFEQYLGDFMESVNDKDEFGRRFQENLKMARKLLNEVEPCLVKDFQALVDTDGNLYHLDFDRCFSPESGTKKYTAVEEIAQLPCTRALDAIAQRVQEAVESK